VQKCTIDYNRGSRPREHNFLKFPLILTALNCPISDIIFKTIPPDRCSDRCRQTAERYDMTSLALILRLLADPLTKTVYRVGRSDFQN